MGFLEIRNVAKNYRRQKILQDIDITIEKGDFLVLVGPSGCGKSTLLNMIAGLVDISAGEIYIAGRRMNDLPPAARNIAMVFQSYALYPNMTVAKNISFGMEMRKIPKAEREAKVAEVAATLQIAHLLQRRPSQLSGGQRQRVAMGRALVRQPSVFLFDEPLSNLDAKLRVEMRAEIKQLHQRLGATIVYVTHDQIEAMTMATRIVVLKGGQVYQQGTAADIYQRPANLFVAGFMGSPPMNLLPVVVAEDGRGLMVELSRSNGKPLQLLLPDGVAAQVSVQQKLVLGLRPEAITALPDGASITMADCRIDLVEPTGADTFVVFVLAGQAVNARLDQGSTVQLGDVLPLYLMADKALWFDAASGSLIGSGV